MGGQQKAELEQQFLLAVDLNEPEALLATLRRAAARKAEMAARGLITVEEGQRWQNVAKALLEAEATVNAATSEDSRKPKQHMAEWGGSAPPASDPPPPEPEGA